MFFEIRLKDKFTELKIIRFVLVSAEKSKSKVKRRISFMKRERMTNPTKINLIYELKLKCNAIGQRIKRKKRNLTQNFSQKDPINHQIKAFHSIFHKTDL